MHCMELYRNIRPRILCGMRNGDHVYFAEYLTRKKHAEFGVICGIKNAEKSCYSLLTFDNVCSVWCRAGREWVLGRGLASATSQLDTRSSRHTVMSSLGQRVTGQLVTGAFFHTVNSSHGQVVTRSSHHKQTLYKSTGRGPKFSGHVDSAGLRLWRPWCTQKNEANCPNFEIPSNRCSVVHPKIDNIRSNTRVKSQELNKWRSAKESFQNCQN